MAQEEKNMRDESSEQETGAEDTKATHGGEKDTSTQGEREESSESEDDSADDEQM